MENVGILRLQTSFVGHPSLSTGPYLNSRHLFRPKTHPDSSRMVAVFETQKPIRKRNCHGVTPIKELNMSPEEKNTNFKRKIVFQPSFSGDMLVFRRVYTSLESIPPWKAPRTAGIFHSMNRWSNPQIDAWKPTKIGCTKVSSSLKSRWKVVEFFPFRTSKKATFILF